MSTVTKNTILNEEIWIYYFYNDTDEGKKVYFRCNQVTRKGIQCQAGLYILIKSDNEQVTLFKTKEQHDHSMKVKNDKLTSAMKLEIY